MVINNWVKPAVNIYRMPWFVEWVALYNGASLLEMLARKAKEKAPLRSLRNHSLCSLSNTFLSLPRIKFLFPFSHLIRSCLYRSSLLTSLTYLSSHNLSGYHIIVKQLSASCCYELAFLREELREFLFFFFFTISRRSLEMAKFLL